MLKKQRTSVKELVNIFDIIEKIDFPSPEWLAGKWFAEIPGCDPIAFALNKRFSIEGISPLIWAMQKGIMIYNKEPIVWAIKNDFDIDGIDPLIWAIRNDKAIEGISPFIWAIEKSIDIQSTHPIVWALDQEMPIEGMHPIIYAAQNNIDIKGQSAILWAEDNVYKIDRFSPLKWAIINDCAPEKTELKRWIKESKDFPSFVEGEINRDSALGKMINSGNPRTFMLFMRQMAVDNPELVESFIKKMPEVLSTELLCKIYEINEKLPEGGLGKKGFRDSFTLAFNSMKGTLGMGISKGKFLDALKEIESACKLPSSPSFEAGALVEGTRPSMGKFTEALLKATSEGKEKGFSK